MAWIDTRPNKNGELSWRVQIRKKGYAYLGKTFSNESAARTWAYETEKAMEDVKKDQLFVLPKFPLKIWIDRYRTEIAPSRKYWNKEIKYFDFWEKNLGNLTATEITPTQIEGVSDEILKTIGKSGQYLSFETRRKYLLVLSSLYGVAIRYWKWATYNPLSGVDMLRRRDRPNNLSHKESPELLDFKTKFCSIVSEKMKSQNLSQRQAANICGLTLHTFQYACIPSNNITLKVFLKICKGFEIKSSIQ
jgi:hypothetical protein